MYLLADCNLLQIPRMCGVRISAKQHIQQYFMQVIKTLIHS